MTLRALGRPTYVSFRALHATGFASVVFVTLLATAGCSSGGSDHPDSGSEASARDGSPNDGARLDQSADAPRDTGEHEAACVPAGEGGPVPDASTYAAMVPRVDQIAFYGELGSKRPDLLAYPPDGGIGPASLCYLSMMMRPSFRAQLLGGSTSVVPATIEVDTAAESEVDEAWIASQQADELAYCAANPGGGCDQICASPPCSACPAAPVGSASAPLAPYYVSGYGLCDYVGYKTGPNVQIYDADGLVWLVYFTFRSLDTDLTPALVHAYGAALSCAGFQGDFKILTDPSRAQQARYQYNDMIVHAHSEHDAELAEAIGLRLFTSGGKTLLAAMGRGLDVHNVQVGAYEQFLVWAEYLCAEHGDLGIVDARSSHAVPFTRYEE
jgi:hypothetical protein